MNYIRCSLCGLNYVHATSSSFLHSNRFPTIYLHAGSCRSAILTVLQHENLPWNGLMKELLFDGTEERLPQPIGSAWEIFKRNEVNETPAA